MSGTSGIEWTEATWNPVTGCTKASPGCKHCYAERFANRLQTMGQPRYASGFRLTLQPDTLEVPLSWRKPRMVFINSMSDLFHEDVPTQYIDAVLQTVRRAHWHIFQVLTERSERLVELAETLNWPRNLWVGVSVENQDYTHRIAHLSKVPASVRFLSLEPLLGPIRALALDGIDWAIVGGESGPGARPMDKKWVLSIRDQCIRRHVPFFFKQWGGFHKKANGRELEGRIWDEMPGWLDDLSSSSTKQGTLFEKSLEAV